MLPPVLPGPLAETAGAFGWQWNTFTDQHPEFREELLEWLNPVIPESFRGKLVLDAGCGNGRHLRLVAQFGAEHVVGLDISSAVDVARRLTTHLANVDVVQGDLLSPPLAELQFDLVYSIGVVHHVPEPGKAIQTLAARLRRGGTLHVWVYAYEGNAMVRWLIDPLRRELARRVPRSIVRPAMLPLAAIMVGAARAYRHFDWIPLLPYRAYLRQIGRFSVRHVWTIVYDQLMAPTTHYVKRHELEGWLRAAGLVHVSVRHSRGMSWAATAQRP
jgi:SAM-dependent methyltransferase